MNEAQLKALLRAVRKDLGIGARLPRSDPTKVKAMVETGNVEWDLAQLSAARS